MEKYVREAKPPPGTIRELNGAYREGSVSPSEVARGLLGLISELNPVLNCFITILSDLAAGQARASDQRFATQTPLGPMDGIPVAVKDVIFIQGVRCTAGSKILAGNVAGYDSPVIRRLRRAGAVLLGTTNLHEFAAGVTSDNPHFGPVRNPWGREHVAGGSSGGSAAAVATGMAPAALGTDTAGSVRIPAALCGVLGLKPTYGRISRLGVIPLAPSLDTVGVLTATAWDAAALLAAVSGHEEGDPTTVNTEVPDYTSFLSSPFSGARVGVARKSFDKLIGPPMREAFSAFTRRLGEAGCKVEDMELDGWDEASANWLPIRRAEATAFHLRWLESVPELYGDDVRKALELGKETRAVDYVRAIDSRPSLMQRFAASMLDFDFVATPTTRVPAPRIGETMVPVAGSDVGVYDALNGLTLQFNMVGFPAISIPVGTIGGLPVGAQLAAKPFEEAKLLRLVHAYEQRFGPFALRRTSQDETR